jgi:hypothetical protein
VTEKELNVQELESGRICAAGVFVPFYAKGILTANICLNFCKA